MDKTVYPTSYLAIVWVSHGATYLLHKKDRKEKKAILFYESF